jgi:hypothetical protein
MDNLYKQIRMRRKQLGYQSKGYGRAGRHETDTISSD